MLECGELGKTYRTPAGEVTALAGVSLTVAPGEFVAIMGPSGSGKSTLLQILAGLERPTSGWVRLEGIGYANLSEEALTVLRRRKIGYIFQSFNLIPGLTAAENVALPAVLDGRRPAAAEVTAALEAVGLGHRRHHRPPQLSGGEQQRVAIARALFHKPRVILADEPTASLDAENAAAVLALLRRAAGQGQAVVMATHDHRAAAQADRIVHLRDGRVADEVGLPRERDGADARSRLRKFMAGEGDQ